MNVDSDYSAYVDGRFNGQGMMNGRGFGKKKQDRRDNNKKTNLDKELKDLGRVMDR